MPCASAYLALAHRPAWLYRGRPCPQGIGRVWDQDLQLRYSVDGSPTCAPAHFSLPPVSSFSDGTSVLCSCSSRPAVVPAFAAAILQQRRSTFCAPAHLDWRTVPRGRCRRGVIHRLVVVAVAGVSQGFRGRHWSAARSTGGTELGGYTGGQYSLRKVVHPEKIEQSRQASSSGAREGSRTPTPSRTAHFECAASTIPPPGPARSLWHKTRLGAHHAHVVLPRGLT